MSARAKIHNYQDPAAAGRFMVAGLMPMIVVFGISLTGCPAASTGPADDRPGTPAVRASATNDFPNSLTKPERDAQVKVIGLFGIVRDITKRKRAEESLHRINRALRMISECNQALVRATAEADLLQSICRIVVGHGGYRMAWVGFAGQDAAETLRP